LSDDIYESDEGSLDVCRDGYSYPKHGTLPRERINVKMSRKHRPSSSADEEDHSHGRHFEYEPLDDADEDIRLLEIHEDKKGKRVTCTMTSMTREDASSKNYRALSYTWGHEELTETIIVNGLDFEVQMNLYSFLQHAARMRRKQKMGWKNGLYWIDAICINQKEEASRAKEKPAQLKHIRKVYRSAFETYIWLGPLDSRMKVAFATLEDYQEHALPSVDSANSAKSEESDNILDESTKFPAQDDNFSTYVKTELSSPESNDMDRLIRAMRVILKNDYWSRVWVLQEVAVSDRKRVAHSATHQNRIRVVCGESEFRWRVFNVLPLLIQISGSIDDRKYWTLQKRIRETQGVWLIYCMYARSVTFRHKHSALAGFHVHSANRLTLPLLIYLSENSKATRGQDYIYGLVGLVQDGWGKNISPGDKRSGSEVLCQVIEYIVDDAREDDTKSATRFENWAKRAQNSSSSRRLANTAAG
jgi:hypothetical protein